MKLVVLALAALSSVRAFVPMAERALRTARFAEEGAPAAAAPAASGFSDASAYADLKQLQKDAPWSAYFKSVYGSLPSTFPLHVQDFWLLYDTALKDAKVRDVPSIARKCPGKNSQEGLHYRLNNI